jgi:hypothetical protein
MANPSSTSLNVLLPLLELAPPPLGQLNPWQGA